MTLRIQVLLASSCFQRVPAIFIALRETHRDKECDFLEDKKDQVCNDRVGQGGGSAERKQARIIKINHPCFLVNSDQEKSHPKNCLPYAGLNHCFCSKTINQLNVFSMNFIFKAHGLYAQQWSTKHCFSTMITNGSLLSQFFCMAFLRQSYLRTYSYSQCFMSRVYVKAIS